jgi:hypothetical protein
MKNLSTCSFCSPIVYRTNLKNTDQMKITTFIEDYKVKSDFLTPCANIILGIPVAFW